MSNKHKVVRLTESLYSRPHLISQRGYDAIDAYLSIRNAQGVQRLDIYEEDHESMEPDEPLFDAASGVGVLEIHGALTYKPVMGMCGAVGTSYQQLISDASQMIDAGVRLIVMDCDSGGGEGYAALETARELRTMCDKAGVRLIAYNDGDMASACYVLGCVADEIVCNPAAETGSIGVLIALMNNSKALEMRGYTRTFISAGESKIPFAEDGSFKPDFLADLQTKVDTMYAEFVTHVSEFTGIPVKEVRATQAKMFMAQDALRIGLINKVMTRSEFTDYLATQIQGMA